MAKETKRKNRKTVEVIQEDGSVELVKLKPEHILFIEYYLISMNGVQAYSKAYPNASYSTAVVNASKLLHTEKIRQEIARRLQDQIISKEEVLRRLADQGRATLHPFIKYDKDGNVLFNLASQEAKDHLHLIKKIKTRTSTRSTIAVDEDKEEQVEEQWVEVELHDAQQALVQLGRYHALFTDKTENRDLKYIKVSIVSEDEE